MAEQWGWSEFVPAGPYRGEIITYPDAFATKEHAQKHLRSYLADSDDPTCKVALPLVREASPSGNHLLVVCPPSRAWFVYRVADGISTGQAAAFFVTDHEKELWRRLLESRKNSSVESSGCAVLMLGAIGAAGALTAGYARTKWGL